VLETASGTGTEMSLSQDGEKGEGKEKEALFLSKLSARVTKVRYTFMYIRPTIYLSYDSRWPVPVHRPSFFRLVFPFPTWGLSTLGRYTRLSCRYRCCLFSAPPTQSKISSRNAVPLWTRKSRSHKHAQRTRSAYGENGK